MDRGTEQKFSPKNIQMTNRYMKRVSTSLSGNANKNHNEILPHIYYNG